MFRRPKNMGMLEDILEYDREIKSLLFPRRETMTARCQRKGRRLGRKCRQHLVHLRWWAQVLRPYYRQLDDAYHHGTPFPNAALPGTNIFRWYGREAWDQPPQTMGQLHLHKQECAWELHDTLKIIRALEEYSL